MTGRGADEADVQLPGESASGLDRAPLGRVHLRHQWTQLRRQPGADRGGRDGAAGAGEQRGADTALEALHYAADLSGRQAQPLGGPAEVQLLVERQQHFDVSAFEHLSLHRCVGRNDCSRNRS